MEIQIDPHTLERAEERGATEKEIKDVIQSGFAIPAKHGRIGRAKVCNFKQKRLTNTMNISESGRLG